MPDTGPPWEIPFLDGTELVRDYPAFSEDLAEQVADGLSAAGGLVAVKHVLKTDTFSASVDAEDNVAVDDLEITHEVADENNRLIITAYFGAAAHESQRGNCGIAVAEGGTLIGVGNADGNRARVGAGGQVVGGPAQTNRIVAMPSVTFVHTPSTGEKKYTVRAVNLDSSTRTVYVNRSELDDNIFSSPRAASALVIQEIKV